MHHWNVLPYFLAVLIEEKMKKKIGVDSMMFERCYWNYVSWFACDTKKTDGKIAIESTRAGVALNSISSDDGARFMSTESFPLNVINHEDEISAKIFAPHPCASRKSPKTTFRI